MADERDIADVLGNYIAARCGADAVQVLDFARMSGGAIQSNYLLTIDCDGGSSPGRHELVVRSDAPSKVQASMSRAQEFAVLQVAHETGMTVPKPLWLCEDESVIGVAFYVMTRAPGAAAGRYLTRGGVTPEQVPGLTRQLGRELALLHTVRPPEPRLGFLARTPGPRALARVAEYRAALDHILQPRPVLEYALNWLEDHAPPAGETVLCHGDFRTGNYMVQDGRVTGVLDWEFASWSDPCEDLGWLCARSWRFGAFDREVGGIGDKPDLFGAYEQASGRKVDPAQVQYWEVMGIVRWSIIALQQAQRHLSGEESSLELALTGRMLPEMEYDLLEQIARIGEGL